MKGNHQKNRRFFYQFTHNFAIFLLKFNILFKWANYRSNKFRIIRQFMLFFLSLFLLGIVVLILLMSSWLLLLDRPMLKEAASRPIDSILVLGGSIRREIYVAEIAKEFPQMPILISSGSAEPCLWLIFQQSQAPIDQVWLQNCATSTFKNYYFALPLLKQWDVHHVKIITSATHLPRAKWLAQIIFGTHGIWTEIDLVPEAGIPGNRETWLKTSLDVIRSFIWARVSQYYSPKCSALKHLATVDMSAWKKRGFKCEHQGRLGEQN
jgi:uncharacterized SAM-binding protein YcdF (DUF218 family)